MKIKIFLIFLVSLILTSGIFAQEEVKFTKGTFSEILAAAKSEDKIIMADFFTDWCVWCVELDNKVYHNQKAAVYMNEHQINWKTDAEKGEGIDLAAKYKVNGYPTIIFLDSDGNEIDRIVGYFPAESFLKHVIDINERNNLTGDLIKDYNANPDGLDANYKLGMKYFDSGDMENAEKNISFVLSHADKNSDMYTECLLKNAAGKGDTKTLESYVNGNPDGKFVKDAELSLAELTYGKDKNFDGAEKIYQSMLAKYPADEDVSFAYAQFIRGKIFTITGDSAVSVDNRISTAEKLLSDNSKYLQGSILEASISARLSNLYLKSGNKEKALDKINRSLTIFDSKSYRDLKDKILNSNQ